MNPSLADALILLLVLPGVAILIAGIVMLRNRIPLIWRGVRVRGRISHIERHSGGAGVRRAYTPWVTFIGPDGVERSLRLDHSPRTRPEPGGELEVYLDPERPTRIFTISWPTLAVFPAITVLAGLIVTAIMLGIYFGREPPGGWPKYEPPAATRN